jgi:hypothetical protein
MQQVNYHLIDSAMARLTVENVKSNGALNIDPDDEGRLRELFTALVRPSVSRWSARYQDKLRLSLAYYLRRPEILDRVLAGQQDLDMPEPSDIVQFFTILWESLFPEQDWRALDATNLEENNDVMEINLTRDP